MTGAQLVFYLFAAATLLSGALVVTARRVLHCALWLAMCLVSVAGLFFLMDADFLGGVQLMVYAGAVTILMIFAVMYAQRLGGEEGFQINRSQALPAAVVAVLLGAFVACGYLGFRPPAPLPALPNSTDLIGHSLLSTYVLPFEVASVLLVAAMVGAIVLARRDPGA